MNHPRKVALHTARGLVHALMIPTVLLGAVLLHAQDIAGDASWARRVTELKLHAAVGDERIGQTTGATECNIGYGSEYHPLPPAYSVGRVTVYLGSSQKEPDPSSQRAAYENQRGTVAFSLGPDRLYRDDIRLDADPSCPIHRYSFKVTGRANREYCNGDCGPYTVEFGLYSGCSESGRNDPLPGTHGTVTFEDDDIYEVEVVLPEGGVLAGSDLWIGLTFDRPYGGFIGGANATVGFSTDRFDVAQSGCCMGYGWDFPRGYHASYSASIYVDAACPSRHPGYMSIFNAGFDPRSLDPGVAAAEDIHLNKLGCRAIGIDLHLSAVDGGAVQLELREDTGKNRPVGDATFGTFAIAGTSGNVVLPPNTSNVVHFPLPEPVTLTQDQLWVVVSSTTPAFWNHTGFEPVVGQTDPSYCQYDSAAEAWIWQPVWYPYDAGGLHATIWCDGPGELGACCDTVGVYEYEEPACQTVPEINCDSIFGHPDFQPEWLEQQPCLADPFNGTCGLGACCTPQDTCENLTKAECDALPPAGASRSWTLGDLCGERGQTCSFRACVSERFGPCDQPHSGRGCEDSHCCNDVCHADTWCCRHDWDDVCAFEAQSRCAPTTQAPDHAESSNPYHATDGVVAQEDRRDRFDVLTDPTHAAAVHEGLFQRRTMAAKPRRPSYSRAALRGDVRTGTQLNVGVDGSNILGDAANAATIAFDPTNTQRLVAAWCQFDDPSVPHRETLWTYSRDGGTTWASPSRIEAGAVRTSPILAADRLGSFYLLSERPNPVEPNDYNDIHEVFTSEDGGASWEPPVFAYGGLRGWLTTDRSGMTDPPGLYSLTVGSTNGWHRVTRSLDGGESFRHPFGVRGLRGTLTVDHRGVLYTASMLSLPLQNRIAVERFANAGMKDEYPAVREIDTHLDGQLVQPLPDSPNNGLYGLVVIASDHSSTSTRGNLYLLASVQPSSGTDPLDIMFSRSQDGGYTWSDPLRVNDDPMDNGAWQWFGTMDVAPNGRIDAVWNDTRSTGGVNRSELYYAYSLDGGHTWSENTPVSPMFDSRLGLPASPFDSLGHYYHIASAVDAVHVIYAATFNGEQDVYYLRIDWTDCDKNGVPDAEDITSGYASDCNGNDVPDSCEPDFDDDGSIDLCDDDIDDDGVPNAEDDCRFSTIGVQVLSDGRTRSNTTGNCGVDLRDYWRFGNCMVGGRLGALPPWDACYEHFDADDNGELNLRDFAAFQNGYTGP